MGGNDEKLLSRSKQRRLQNKARKLMAYINLVNVKNSKNTGPKSLNLVKGSENTGPKSVNRVKNSKNTGPKSVNLVKGSKNTGPKSVNLVKNSKNTGPKSKMKKGKIFRDSTSKIVKKGTQKNGHLKKMGRNLREQQKEQNGKRPRRNDRHLSATAENYSKLKQMKRQIDKARMPWPSINLSEAGLKSQITSENKTRTPLTIREVQSSLLHVLLPSKFPIPPKWGKIMQGNNMSHKVMIVVEGIGIKDLMKYVNHKDISEYKGSAPEWLVRALPRTCMSLLPIVFELLPSSGEPLHNILNMASPNMGWGFDEKGVLPMEDDNEQKMKNEMETPKIPPNIPNFLNISNGNNEDDGDLPPSDVFDRRQLLLTPSDMYLHNFPVPFNKDPLENGYVFSKAKYAKATPSSPMFGLDCEMCLTLAMKNELTSVSLVNEEGKTVYHKLVKPKNKIINYLTKYSGITKAMLQDVTTTVQDVQADLRKLLPPDAIIVGHSVNNDLQACKIMHPYVIDSALAYNLTFVRKRPTSLKVLVSTFLNKKIQMGEAGHDPTEDAIASLELIQLKLSKGFTFGNVIEGFKMENGFIQTPQVKVDPEELISVFKHTVVNNVKSAVLMSPMTANCCQPMLESLPEDVVDIHIINGNKELSKKAAEVVMSKEFTYLHLRMQKIRGIESKEAYGHELEKLDKKLQRVFKACCERALVMVVVTGSQGDETGGECSNGLVMCTVKGISMSPKPSDST